MINNKDYVIQMYEDVKQHVLNSEASYQEKVQYCYNEVYGVADGELIDPKNNITFSTGFDISCEVEKAEQTKNLTDWLEAIEEIQEDIKNNMFEEVDLFY